MGRVTNLLGLQCGPVAFSELTLIAQSFGIGIGTWTGGYWTSESDGLFSLNTV